PGEARAAVEQDCRAMDLLALLGEEKDVGTVKALLLKHIHTINDIHMTYSVSYFTGQVMGGGMTYQDFAHFCHRHGVLHHAKGETVCREAFAGALAPGAGRVWQSGIGAGLRHKVLNRAQFQAA
ncbi:unnamed protein product, partial [Discosporangium mesarthrocarpum]